VFRKPVPMSETLVFRLLKLHRESKKGDAILLLNIDRFS